MEKIQLVLVDDHEMVLQSLAHQLSQIGDLEIMAAFSKSRDLLLFLKDYQPDMIIMDVMLDEQTAFTLLEQIKQTAIELPKVIFISGYYDQQLHQKALQIGVKAFLNKEASTKELVDAIRSVSQGNVVIPDDVFNQPDDEILSSVELEVLRLMAAEETNAQIAAELFISRRTVESHVSNICRKLGVNGRIGAVREALRKKIIE
ncbi:MAG: response regulator transcription factor [Limosilactobacillus gorillae]|jgi:DNA-binding NarL/FixJ family response regulator|uniref:response regulator transcription factor n=1 Tax=Limosilactobacillus gorillae TaxID=1450649 RepID=UPI000B220650|nr:response regulator transcription factor [Limosilactobacillus gorillae]MDO4855544.1 response regulator transcription factor [Limosilactobacillus gorillae]